MELMVFLILCVLLFGASAVWGVIKWGCLVPVLLLVIIIVLVTVGAPFNEYMKQATRPATKERIEPPIEQFEVRQASPKRTVADAISADCQVISVRMAQNVFSAVQREALYKDCVARSTNKY